MPRSHAPCQPLTLGWGYRLGVGRHEAGLREFTCILCGFVFHLDLPGVEPQYGDGKGRAHIRMISYSFLGEILNSFFSNTYVMLMF